MYGLLCMDYPWKAYYILIRLGGGSCVTPQESHLKSFWSSRMVFICSTLRLPAWVNDFPQDSHLKSLSPSWTVLVYPLRELAWVNSFPQDSHLKFLSPSWTVLICPLRESAWANYVSSDMTSMSK